MNRLWEWLLDTRLAEMAGSDDWELGFVADFNNYVKLALVVVFAFLVYLTIRSYRREGEAPRRVKATLAALRISVLVLVLLVILRPAIVLKFSKTLFSDVVFVVDDSMSMSLADKYEPQPRRRLAQFLNVNEAEVQDLSRMEIVRRALSRGGGAVARLAADHPLLWMSFSTDRPEEGAYVHFLGTMDLVDRETPSPSARPPEGLADLLKRLSTRGYETKIPVALSRVLQEIQGRRATVVLISDGQNTKEVESPTVQQIKKEAADQGVPLHTVLVGSPRRPEGIWVAELRGSARVMRGSQMRLTARLAYCNIPQDTEVMVRLLRSPKGRQQWTRVATGGAPVLLRKPSEEDFNRTLYVSDVEIEYTPREVGEFQFKAAVDQATDGAAGDSNVLTVNVLDEKIRVLLVSADAGWEFQFLRNFLLRQPDLYRVSVWQQNADPDVNQAASTGMKLAHLPRTLEELIGSPGGKPHPGYNVVILYDPMPTQGGFDGAFADMIHRFVYDHGGGLCYITGNKHSQTVFRTKQFKPIRDLIPVEIASDVSDVAWRISGRRREAFGLTVTPYGADHPVMVLGETPDLSGRTWGALPGVYWSQPVRRPKRGARVLAVHGNPLRQTEDEEPEPVIAFQQYGSGRVLYLGTDETWRWRYIDDGRCNRRFWSNAVRFLATLKPRLIEIILAKGQSRVNVAEEVKLEVRAHNEKYQPLTEATFAVDVVNLADGSLRKVTLKAVRGDPGKYAGSLRFGREGDYEITALSGDPLQGEKVAAKRIEVRLPDAETRNPQADAGQMARIASSGSYREVWQIEQLAEQIPPGRLTAITPVPHELWDSKLALLVIVALLCVEWIIRKKHNMT
jgi:hypothetical protein